LFFDIVENMSGFPFSGPIAAQNNPAIEPQWFQPSLFPITAISYGSATTVTTGTSFGISNNYVVGQLVRLVIPFPYGARQLNERQAYVVSIPGSNQVVLDINTTIGFDPFIPSPSYSTTVATITAIGDINTGPLNSSINDTGTTIPGTFTNISPSAGG
jgi:hypothetical protein